MASLTTPRIALMTDVAPDLIPLTIPDAMALPTLVASLASDEITPLTFVTMSCTKVPTAVLMVLTNVSTAVFTVSHAPRKSPLSS